MKATIDGKLMFPSDYVSAVELAGRDVTMQIESVARAELMVEGGKKKPGITVAFKGTAKKLVLNKTNASTIASLYGTAAEKWPGNRVTLYPTTCKCKGETVECIRIRPVVPPEKTQA